MKEILTSIAVLLLIAEVHGLPKRPKSLQRSHQHWMSYMNRTRFRNATLAKEGDYPYMAYIMNEPSMYTYTAIIISAKYVLTSTLDMDVVGEDTRRQSRTRCKVYAGLVKRYRPGGNFKHVQTRMCAAKFHLDPSKPGLCVVQVDKNFRLNKYVNTAVIAIGRAAYKKGCKSVAFGSKDDPANRKMELKHFPYHCNFYCKDVKVDFVRENFSDKEKFVCGYSLHFQHIVDIDLGSPLVCSGRVQGVAVTNVFMREDVGDINVYSIFNEEAHNFLKKYANKIKKF